MVGDAARVRLINLRIRGLLEAWMVLSHKPKLRNREMFTFNRALALKAVLHYVDDLGFLKQRYKIPDRVQPPKVAGLMANAVLKYRPLVPTNGNQADIEQNELNEFLAVYNGLCVCAGYRASDVSALNALILTPHFKEWIRRFVFLLRERNYTSESLVMVFETLCWKAFPDSFAFKTELM